MDNTNRHTLAVLVDNESGVLSRVVRLFSGKGYNIESLAVGTTDNPQISRMTIEVRANENHTNLICAQLAKMVPVHSVKLLVPGHSIRRELVLYKVRARNSEDKNEIIQIANIFRASVVDISKNTLMLQLSGDSSKTEAILKLLSDFGIMEMARTGMIALERGENTIYDLSKAGAEYESGK